jgi:hypothetical protein
MCNILFFHIHCYLFLFTFHIQRSIFYVLVSIENVHYQIHDEFLIVNNQANNQTIYINLYKYFDFYLFIYLFVCLPTNQIVHVFHLFPHH